MRDWDGVQEGVGQAGEPWRIVEQFSARRSGLDAARQLKNEHWWFVMNNVSIGLLSAAEFEIARGMMSELSTHLSYDDWLDWRYGTFMGRSIGGEDAGLMTVGLAPFLEWCAHRGVRPSESALDAFAARSELARERRSAA
jgi:hypothetical protein